MSEIDDIFSGGGASKKDVKDVVSKSKKSKSKVSKESVGNTQELDAPAKLPHKKRKREADSSSKTDNAMLISQPAAKRVPQTIMDPSAAVAAEAKPKSKVKPLKAEQCTYRRTAQ